MSKKCVFLDRDGVINEDSPEYIKKREEFHFIEGAEKSVRLLNDHGFSVIVVTNQSAVNRGMITHEILKDIHDKMIKGFKEKGADLLDIFYCPHHPDENCACRKPKTAMLMRAAEKHGIDLSGAYFVGDSAKDVECAKNAGLKAALLVKTGNGLKAKKELARKNIAPDDFVPDLFHACRRIVEMDGK